MSSTVFAAPVLEQLAGPKPVPLDDRLWQSVLAFTTPASRFDPAEVEAAIRPHLAALGERAHTAAAMRTWTLAG